MKIATNFTPIPSVNQQKHLSNVHVYYKDWYVTEIYSVPILNLFYIYKEKKRERTISKIQIIRIILNPLLWRTKQVRIDIKPFSIEQFDIDRKQLYKDDQFKRTYINVVLRFTPPPKKKILGTRFWGQFPLHSKRILKVKNYKYFPSLLGFEPRIF